MRITLQVPFAEKDQARALGARWDLARKVWYIVDQPNLKPFICWMPDRVPPPVAKPKHNGRKRGNHAARHTPRTDFSLPDCCCASAPWEDCEHTSEPPLADDALAHIRSIRENQ